MPKKTRPRKPARKSNLLVSRLKPGQTPEALDAEMMVGGLAMNAIAAVGFSQGLGDLDLTACVTALEAATLRVTGGDLRDTEALLTAQSVALNTIFTDLAHRT